MNTYSSPFVISFEGFEENGKRFYVDPFSGEKKEWPEKNDVESSFTREEVIVSPAQS
jgi:hypothetical protein